MTTADIQTEQSHVLYVHTGGLRCQDAEVYDFEGTLSECRAELTRAPEAYPFFQFGVIVNAKTRAEVGFASRLGCR